MTESVGNNENLNDFGTTVMKTHFRLSALTELTGEFDYYKAVSAITIKAQTIKL
jgi:hypothetical protein